MMLKNFIVLLICMFISSSVLAANLKVAVWNIAGNKGRVRVAVCDKATFLKDCPYGESVEASEKEVLNFNFNNIPAGQYALMVYHDENDNGKLDRNFMGIPKEGYGFSRQAQGKFGPPKFEDAVFDLAEPEAEQRLHIEY